MLMVLRCTAYVDYEFRTARKVHKEDKVHYSKPKAEHILTFIFVIWVKDFKNYNRPPEADRNL